MPGVQDHHPPYQAPTKRFSALPRAPYLFVSFCSAGFFVGPDFFRTKARDPHVPLTLWKRERRSAPTIPITHRTSGLVITNILAAGPPGAGARDKLVIRIPAVKASQKQSSRGLHSIEHGKDAVPVLGTFQHRLMDSYKRCNCKIWRGGGWGQIPHLSPDY